VHPELRALIELQSIDDRAGAARRKIAAVPGRIQSEKRQLGDFEGAVAGVQKALDAGKKRQRETEREIQAADQKLREARGKQALVKTNEEYRALSSEIASFEGRISSLEDAVLEIMESVPSLEKKLAQAKAELEAARGRVRAAVSWRLSLIPSGLWGVLSLGGETS